MALWTWVRLLWNSVAAAAMVAAAQLGAAYGLDIVRWNQNYAAGNDNAWSAGLTWTAFTMVVAVLVGAGLGRRSIRRPRRRENFGMRLAAAFAACVGAAATIPLVWLPARDAQPTANVDPELVVVITATAAIVAGFVLALLALSIQPVAGNVVVTLVWAWIIGIVAATAGSGAATRLAVLDLDSSLWTVRGNSAFATRLAIGLAAVFAIVVAGVARWSGNNRIGIAISGGTGPALIAAAYLIAGPGVTRHPATQYAPYVASLVAVGVGLIGSTLVALIGRRGPAAEPVEELDDDTVEFLPRPMPPAELPPITPKDQEYVGWLQDLSKPGEGEPKTTKQGAQA